MQQQQAAWCVTAAYNNNNNKLKAFQLIVHARYLLGVPNLSPVSHWIAPKGCALTAVYPEAKPA